MTSAYAPRSRRCSVRLLGGTYGVINAVSGCRGCDATSARTFRRLRCDRPCSYFRWQTMPMVLGQKSPVPNHAFAGNWCRRRSGLVRRNLPTHHIRNVATCSSRCRPIHRFFHIALAGNDFVLSSANVGVCSLLHSIWGCGRRQLVLGVAETVHRTNASR